MGLTDLAITPGLLVSATGWLVVVIAVVTAMIRGWLIPGSQVDRLTAAYDRTIADKDQQIRDWREAARISDARGDLLARSQERMVESIGTTNDLIRAVGTAVGTGGQQ